ncbi:MAG: signal peptidase I [Mollicutes bacterium]|nr:signal peptidase I [Mollicutes bacterium]
MKGLLAIRKNKVLNIIFKTIYYIFIVFLIAFVLVVCLQRFSNDRISFFKYRMFTVISGSMEPKYKVGDVLIAKEVEPSKIKVGDTISYLGMSGDFAGKVITHQVVGINQNQDGKYIFSAKGLKNLVVDPSISEDQLYGVVIYRCPILSFLYKIISTNLGFYLFIIIPLMYIIGYEIINVLLKKEEKRRMGF